MKFLVDAQLPARLARLLNEHGHDATHTSELPNGNRTPDDEIAAATAGIGGAVRLIAIQVEAGTREQPVAPREHRHQDRDASEGGDS